jgi:uncharacterized protein
MRKATTFLLAAFVLVGIFFILRSYFPKYTIFLPWFLIIIFLDIYLWYSIAKAIRSRKPLTRNLLTCFYWLPLFLLFSIIIAGFVKPFIYWNIFWRTYLIAIIAIVYICRLFPILFLILADIISLIIRLSRLISGKGFARRHTDDTPMSEIVNQRITVKNMILSAGWIIGTAFFVLFIAGMIFWNFDFRVRQETIHLPELPASFNGMRIVQISDIHLGNWGFQKKLKEAADIVNSLHPDIVFFTGDLVNYTSYEAYGFANILKEIKAPLGIFAIMGNHDYGEYVAWSSPEGKIKNLNYLCKIYQYLDWKLLRNEHIFIHRGSDSIAVIGVENWGGTKRFPRLGDIAKATKGAEKTPVQLLLSHDPSHWDSIVKDNFRNIDITFSGHTHGFQFGLECCGIKWSPFQNIYREWAGLYSEPDSGSHPQYLYVNRGLGSIGYPGRVGILPEITLIVLRK